MGAPTYVAIEELKRKLGTFTMKERDMKIKLCYLNCVLNG